MDAFYFPRGEGKIPPKFHLIPPKFYFSPTWRIFIFHVEIGEFPRGGWRERGEWGASAVESFSYICGERAFAARGKGLSTNE